MRVVSVHRNLNKGRKEGVKYYSVKDRKTQRVNGDVRSLVVLLNVRLTVREAARQRVIAGGHKEVYAWAHGLDAPPRPVDAFIGSFPSSAFEQLCFMPKEGFYVRRKSRIIHVVSGACVVMNQHGSFIAGAKER